MTPSQEEALYDFLDNIIGIFSLDEVVSYIRKIESRRINKLAIEVEAFINLRNMAFPIGPESWISRRGYFEPLPFVINPSRLELVNGILIPGHRCIPFANSSLLPQEYTFFWQGDQIPFTSTEGAPEDFYPFYSIFGEEYAPQYVAQDNSDNESAFNKDPYDDPPEVSIKTLDMRNIYREVSFVPGDQFTVRSMDWKAGYFSLQKVSKDEWSEGDLHSWFKAAEEGFENSFINLGPASCTEEQIAYAYWYGDVRMREIPAYALEDFLYEKTGKIEAAPYGIETRFWYAGREIPDLNGLDTSDSRPDKTPVEEIFYKLKNPISEYVIQSYVRDFLYREEKDVRLIAERLIPPSVEINDRDKKSIADYIESVLEEFRTFYNPFTDKAMGLIRLRAGELHTAVIDLAGQLSKGDIDISWFPRHTFIVLSQIRSHTASVLEDLDSDDTPPEAELEALDASMDSMIETYADIKELIEEAMESFRRNKLAVIRSDTDVNTVMECLIQLSIGGIDVWRRIIIPENLTLEELHKIIQTIFNWRNSQPFEFYVENSPHRNSVRPLHLPTEAGRPGENIRKFPAANSRAEKSADSGRAQYLPNQRKLYPGALIQDLKEQDNIELLYEYGTKWNVRIMILSRTESPISKPVRCVAGAGMAPPEFIDGPIKFKRALAALENGNDSERLNARQELGTEYIPGEFDLDSCNRSLNALFFLKGSSTDR